MTFIKNPNLPMTSVSTVIIGEEYSHLLMPSLDKLNISAVVCPKNNCVDERLSSHADLSVVHIGGNNVLISSAVATESFTQSLSDIGVNLTITDYKMSAKYPLDAILCAALIGNKLIHNHKITDRKLIELAQCEPLYINQGYSKCTICPIDENTAITSDRGATKALQENGFDVLLINSGGIHLNGFSEGFIGGGSFKPAKDKLAFTGRIDNLRDYKEILDFLDRHQITPMHLTELEIYDIGSIIPLMEI